MKLSVFEYFPTGSAVKIVGLECGYKGYKEPTTFAAGQKEGVHASVYFNVLKNPQASGEAAEGSDESSEPGGSTRKIEGVEAVEFTFALYDVFDNFLASVQGLAGPGNYRAVKKRHRAQWIFEVEGAFSQYHALCFPSQIRFTDGAIWRCDRVECVGWLNEQMRESGVIVAIEDIFPDGAMREGLTE